ncbi:MAG: hypothetical protein NTZ95_02255, partial [Candidatus Omnitrophica bacterium]|nr:hypothetical protein [Candidatus Omnitrophota bacterium]
EDADVFEFKPVVQAAPLTPALPSLAVATISSSPGKYGVSPDLSQAGSYKADATTIDAQVALAELFDNRPAYQPESELLSAFKIDANDRLKFYRMITNKEDLKKYFALVAQRALDVADPEVSRGLQIMAGQALAIISLIEDKVPGAEKLLLTVNPVDMLRAEDKDRGLSYIDTHSVIDSGIDIADAEGASYGMYWRGAEGVAKLGSNISAEAIYDKEKFDSQSPKMVMYLMLHIGGYHTTVFLHDYLPGSIQHTSTGPGHLQNDSMDIKYVVSGRGIQWNKDDKGGTAYRLERGSWTVAYPYYVDEIVNLGGLVFKDFSFTIPGVAPRTLTAAVPYIAVTVNGQEAFVANRTDKLTISFRAHTSPKEGTISMRDLYGYNNMDRYLNRPLETGSSTRPVVIITPDQVARAAQVVGLTASAAPIPMEPQFNLGSKGYMWGQSVVQSFILAQMGAKTEAERLALAAKFGIAADDQVAERIVASKLGASPITAKVLASAVPLSVQLHTFSEMIVPLEKGKAYLGLKQNMTAEEIIEACMQGRMHEVMNEIELEPGVPMIVPANVPHAYGQVKVYEVKAVTPEEDKNGTVSFFDRLKFLITKPGASLKMTAEELRSQNPGREGKDILTMNEVALAKTRAALEEAQRQGGLNRVEPASLKFEPFGLRSRRRRNLK